MLRKRLSLQDLEFRQRVPNMSCRQQQRVTFGPHTKPLSEIDKGQTIAIKGFLTKRSHSSDIPVFIINEYKTT